MRAAAQIEPLALPVDLDLLVLGDGIDQFDLEGFALVGEDGFRLLARPHFLGEGFVAGDDLAHLLFDGGQVFRGEGLVAGEIVIKAVLDDGSDGHLGAGIELLHGFGHHMRAVVADEFQRFGVVAGDDAHLAVLADGIGKIAQFAVEAERHRLLFQRFGDGRRQLAPRDAFLERAHRTVGECEIDHRISSCSLAANQCR